MIDMVSVQYPLAPLCFRVSQTFGVTDPYLQIFFSRPKQTQNKVFSKKKRSSLRISSSDFMAWIPFEEYMYEKFCHVDAEPSLGNSALDL